ncbi:hypothetical protein IE077_002649 [Cardiosporidium cionae]|uniref:Transmembrane protein 234 n=1 Tax=Cardiosporidium cionae TaxID=476202 RepID=A0ABQ7JFW8_9APIC|nr:hypothetical protein IE077_002649 [Cardiosporidium cionae]|eukprot:KAF8822779.1 hypothetical protein IE077_002649 [Cardiosporidium cionae]
MKHALVFLLAAVENSVNWKDLELAAKINISLIYSYFYLVITHIILKEAMGNAGTALSLTTILEFVIVGFLWGCTTPFLRKESGGILKEKNDGEFLLKRVFRSILQLFSRWEFLLPYLINQLGSAGFYYLLGAHDLSIVVPVVNCISFFFTFWTESILFRDLPELKTIVGSGMILLGLYICLQSSQHITSGV